MSKIIRPKFKKKSDASFPEEQNDCVEIKDGFHYCPVDEWYMRDGCPFLNRRECDNYQKMCNNKGRK